MLTDDIADRIALASHPAELDQIAKDMWGAYDRLTDNDMEYLDQVVGARRKALQSRSTGPGPRAPTSPKKRPRAAARRRQRSPDRQASIERRRNLSGEVPRPIRAQYTEGQAAALAVIGQEVQTKGLCDASVPEIAARAGVSDRIVQTATQLAKGNGHLTVEYRRRSPFRNDTNVIHIISQEWLTSLRLKGQGENGRTARRQVNNKPDRNTARPARPWAQSTPRYRRGLPKEAARSLAREG